MTSPKVPEHNNRRECVTVESGMSEVKLTPLTNDSSASFNKIRCKLFLPRLFNSY